VTASVQTPRDYCRAEVARHARVRRKRIALGQPSTELVDAGPARAHVNELRSRGMGWERVAAKSGVAPSTVFRLLWSQSGYPPSRRIHRDTADALLALQLDPVMVPGVGARRRIQALVATGRSARALSRELGKVPTYLGKLLRNSGPVHRDTDRQIRDLYDRLWNQPPPQDTVLQRRDATNARNLAERRGWPRPQCWDDDVIDDPDARPDYGYGRPGNAAANADLVAALTAQGATPSEIVAKTGLSRSSVFRLRGRRAS
jgi:hypothetical protein